MVNYPTGQGGLKMHFRVLYIVCQEKKIQYIVFPVLRLATDSTASSSR